MALQCASVTCSYIRVADGTSLVSKPVWTRKLVSGQPTDVSAQRVTKESEADYWASLLDFEVTTDHDIWIAWGLNPDASKDVGKDDSARILVRAGETRNVFCYPGDRFASFDA